MAAVQNFIRDEELLTWQAVQDLFYEAYDVVRRLPGERSLGHSKNPLNEFAADILQVNVGDEIEDYVHFAKPSGRDIDRAWQIVALLKLVNNRNLCICVRDRRIIWLVAATRNVSEAGRKLGLGASHANGIYKSALNQIVTAKTREIITGRRALPDVDPVLKIRLAQ